jgi:hypothetical protein
MNLDTFPLFRRLLTDPSVYATQSRFERPYSPQRVQQLEDALELWTRCLKAGEIENPRFIESKETISRALEHAWKMPPRDHVWLRTLPEAHWNALDTVPSPNLANLPGRQKRVAKTSPSPLRDELLAFMEEFKPIAEAYVFLKEHSKKRVVRNPDEAEPRYVPPPSSSTAVAQARTLLEQVVDRAYQHLLEHTQVYNRDTIQRYLDAQAQYLADPATDKRWGYSPRTHFTVKEGRFKGHVFDSQGLSLLSKVLQHKYGPNHVGQYVADAQTWLKSDAEAERETQTLRDKFVFKNLKKLTPILETKGDPLFDRAEEKDQTVRLGDLKGDFNFLFKDGSSFRVHNALVYVVNAYGTQFHRFPLTFHDVVLPGGQPLALPSEESMNTVWAKASASPQPTEPTPRRRRSP